MNHLLAMHLLMKEADSVFWAILCHKSVIKYFLPSHFWSWHKMAKVASGINLPTLI